MALSSMTGFARSQGASGPYVWGWEIKSVNGKGLDLRFRLPAGWDAVEVAARKRATEALARGTGRSKKDAEQAAAEAALESLGT